jgi:small subunit ribosomal protein S20
VANIKSQKKRILTNQKAADRNKAVRSELKTRVKSALSAATSGAENADDALKLAVRRIDKAATKGVIHKNAAARRKSRLMRQANLAASAEG